MHHHLLQTKKLCRKNCCLFSTYNHKFEPGPTKGQYNDKQIYTQICLKYRKNIKYTASAKTKPEMFAFLLFCPKFSYKYYKILSTWSTAIGTTKTYFMKIKTSRICSRRNSESKIKIEFS